MAETMTKVFGIDLGTTYSCIAYVDEYEKPNVVPNLENERITPSVVFFEGESVIVGTEAKRNSKLSPSAVVSIVKRFMGDPNWIFEFNGKTYRPEVISSFILRKLVGDAKQVLGEEITDVVITCPAYFGINQREATANAGKIAGLNVLSIINEPTAAAVSYGMHHDQDQVVLVYDLGGGTFDITMIEIKSGAITVLCTGGDHDLGGTEWDTALVNYLVSCYQQETGTGEDILEDADTCQELFLSAEAVKKTLSTREKAPLQVSHGGKRVKVELTREKFEELTAGWLERTVTLTHEMLKEAVAKGHNRFDKILLVGGSTRMPCVPARLKKEFNVPCEMFDPDEAVAKGAAIFGRAVAVKGKVIEIIEKQTGQKVDDLGQVDAQAITRAQAEAAEQLGLSSKAVTAATNQRLIDVTSKTFGIKVLVQKEPEEFRVSNLILRNDPVPRDVTKTYQTVTDGQEDVEIICFESLVLEALADLAQCSELGRFDMALPPGLAEGSPIEVNFKLDKQGRLKATATEPNSKFTKTYDLQTEAVMSKDEVEKATARALQMDVS